MTIFGILWCCIVLWSFSKDDIKYMFSITLLFMTFQSANVVVINGVGIGPQILTSIIFVLKSLVRYGGKIVYRRKYRMEIFLVLLLFMVVVMSCIYNNILAEKMLNILQLLSYVMCFVCIVLCKRNISSEDLYKILRAITVFHLVLGAVQLLTTLEILPIRWILNVLFYNDTSRTVQFHFRNYGRIMSTFMEPSYLAGLLVGMFFFFLSMVKRWKENLVLMSAIVIELLLTRSSTAYGAFLAVGMVFIIFNSKINLKLKILISILAIAAFAVVYFGFYDLLDSVVFSKTKTGSYLTRTNWNNATIRMFEASPLLGVGYKNTRGSSIIHSLLGELGISGLLAYMFFNLAVFSPIVLKIKKAYKFSELDIGLRFAVMGAFACQIIACPDLDLCTYWFWIYFMGMGLKASVSSPHLMSRTDELMNVTIIQARS